MQDIVSFLNCNFIFTVRYLLCVLDTWTSASVDHLHLVGIQVGHQPAVQQCIATNLLASIEVKPILFQFATSTVVVSIWCHQFTLRPSARSFPGLKKKKPWSRRCCSDILVAEGSPQTTKYTMYQTESSQTSQFSRHRVKSLFACALVITYQSRDKYDLRWPYPTKKPPWCNSIEIPQHWNLHC